MRNWLAMGNRMAMRTGNDVSYGNSCFRNGNSLIINVFTDIVFLTSDVGGWIPFRMLSIETCNFRACEFPYAQPWLTGQLKLYMIKWQTILTSDIGGWIPFRT